MSERAETKQGKRKATKTKHEMERMREGREKRETTTKGDSKGTKTKYGKRKRKTGKDVRKEREKGKHIMEGHQKAEGSE